MTDNKNSNYLRRDLYNKLNTVKKYKINKEKINNKVKTRTKVINNKIKLNNKANNKVETNNIFELSYNQIQFFVHKLNIFKNKIIESNNLVVLYDDDPDGISSYLLLNQLKPDNKGVLVKSTPVLQEKFIQTINKDTDLILVLDKADLSKEFLKLNLPILWIDHHNNDYVESYKKNYIHKNLLLFNPLIYNITPYPTTLYSYLLSQDKNHKDWKLFLLAVGSLGDWYVLRNYLKELKKINPELIDLNIDKIKNPGELYYNTKLGEFIKIFAFILKGNKRIIKQCINHMKKMNDYHQILEDNLIIKQYNYVNDHYEILLKDIMDKNKNNKQIISYIYRSKISLSSELSNEVSFKTKAKIIMIGRKKNDYIRLSIRSTQIPVRSLLLEALRGLDGYGGGHEYACGAFIHHNDYPILLNRIKKAINNNKYKN